MFDADTLFAALIAIGLVIFGRWLAGDNKWPRWTPRIIKGGRK